MSIYLGLMSGTSMDGIDAALVEVETHQLLAGLTQPYSQKAYDQIQAVMNEPQISLAQVWQLNTLLGEEFASAANALLQQSHYQKDTITAIGSHGQTIRHDINNAQPYTIQLACPHTIAELTGLPVVADFRTRDMVVGGQGAPFAPLYHQALFGQFKSPLGIVNIGGIANITVLSPNKPSFGYDIGPGNCLLDAWVQKQLGIKFDQNGTYAAQGQVIPELLEQCKGDLYFQRPFPKSVCKSYFSLDWLQTKLLFTYTPHDVQATLLELSAQTIATAVMSNSIPLQRLAVCGGGAHNSMLLTRIQQLLSHLTVLTTQDLGIHPDFLEAMMFAWLAHQTLSGIPMDLRSITGARKPVILGAIYKV